MNKVIVSDGDKVVIDFSDKVIELYIDPREPLGFRVQMISKNQDYLDIYKQTSKALKEYVKKLDKQIRNWH